MKPISAALTSREQDSLNLISGLFQKPILNSIIPKQEYNPEQEDKDSKNSSVDLEKIISGARDLLKS